MRGALLLCLALLLLLLLGVTHAQEPLLTIGNFFQSFRYAQGTAPSCLVPACDEDQNVNFVLPPLCCNLLPTGAFLQYNAVTTQVNFSVPQFLSAALAVPACRGTLFADTQSTFAFLESGSHIVVNVFEGVGAKIPWCVAGDPCLPAGVTLMNLYVPTPCASDYCPYGNGTALSKRGKDEGLFEFGTAIDAGSSMRW